MLPIFLAKHPLFSDDTEDKMQSQKLTVEKAKSEGTSVVSDAALRFGTIKPFGAIIFSRPEYFSCTSTIRAYVFNPEIVKTYTDQVSLKGISHLLDDKNYTDVKTLRNVNELRVRNSYLQSIQKEIKEANTRWWTESQSGNEFTISADLWSNST